MFLYHCQFDGPLKDGEGKTFFEFKWSLSFIVWEFYLKNPRTSEAGVVTHITASGLAHYSPID